MRQNDPPLVCEVLIWNLNVSNIAAFALHQKRLYLEEKVEC